MQKQCHCCQLEFTRPPRCFTSTKNKQMPDGADRKAFVGPQTKKCPVSSE